jgi:hypothetical protein
MEWRRFDWGLVDRRRRRKRRRRKRRRRKRRRRRKEAQMWCTDRSVRKQALLLWGEDVSQAGMPVAHWHGCGAGWRRTDEVQHGDGRSSAGAE